jgi:endo-1,4-beta-xylanase
MKKISVTGLLLLVCCLLAACVTTSKEQDIEQDGGEIFTENSGRHRPLDNSPYGYEMWTQGGDDNKLIWYGPDKRGGAAFRTEWNNPNIYLGRVGFYWGRGGKYTEYKNMYADFSFTRSGRNTAGNHSYIGIYGWGRNPTAEKPEDQLVEYYIVEDWFGNQWQDDTTPITTNTTGGEVLGSFKMDGGFYNVIRNVRIQEPSIDGTKTFVQFFSVRQTPRKKGTISITEHFKQWERLGLHLGNMYEAKFLVEAGSGTGWLELSYLKLTQEDNPR